MAFDPKQPFNDLPLLPPTVEVETKAVLKACIGANRALAELKGAGDLIPNQAMLINAIALQEAKDSSAIENIVTTKDKLFLAAADPSSAKDDPSTKEVLRYRTALNHGSNGVQAEGLSLQLLCSVCSQLRDQKIKVRDEEPIIIGNQATRTITYTPPRGRAVITAKLNNLVEFLSDGTGDGLDPLVKMAMANRPASRSNRQDLQKPLRSQS